MFDRRNRRAHSEHNCTVCLERDARQARTDNEMLIPSDIRTMADADLLFLSELTPVLPEVEVEVILRELKYVKSQKEVN